MRTALFLQTASATMLMQFRAIAFLPLSENNVWHHILSVVVQLNCNLWMSDSLSPPSDFSSQHWGTESHEEGGARRKVTPGIKEDTHPR
eukprot:scaffold104172_cov17-Tisochrysis_lutea.AAC.1